MKTILSIDFDIIMAPTINFYNHLVPKAKWETLQLEPITNMFYADYRYYQELTKFLLKLIKKYPKEKFHFIQNHDSILKFIKDDKINLINIDHHHDLGYKIELREKKVLPSQITVANWVKYLKDNNQLNSYIWISSFSSEERDDLLPTGFGRKYIDEQLYLHDINLLDYMDKDFDEIIICLSPEWVPIKYRDLYFTWFEIFNTFYDHFFKFED